MQIGIPVDFMPESCLLHLLKCGNKSETILLNNVLVAAKMLIAKNWKSTKVSSIQEWRIKSQYTLLMNKLSAIKSKNNRSDFAVNTFYTT